MRYALICLALVAALLANHSLSVNAAKNKPAAEASPHPYAKEFAKYGISDDYKNRVPAKGLTDTEKREVNNLIDDATQYLISRIEKDGKIPELQMKPGGDRMKHLDPDDPETWVAFYLTPAVTEMFRALVVTQDAKLGEEQETALLRALRYATDKSAKWRYADGNNSYRSGELSNRCGDILALGEVLDGLEPTPLIKKARKVIAREQKRISERAEGSWTSRGCRLYSHNIDPNDCPEHARKFPSSARLLNGLTICPTNASKKRVRIAEDVLEMMVDSAHVHDEATFPRYSKPKRGKGEPANDGWSTKAPSKGEDTVDGEVLDASVFWARWLLDPKYADDEYAKRFRAAFMEKNWTERYPSYDNESAIPIFINTFRYLARKETKRFHSKETAKLLERAKPLLWNIIATISCAIPDGQNDQKREFPFIILHDLVTSDLIPEVHPGPVLGSPLYLLSQVGTALKREKFGEFEWYAEAARAALKMRDVDGALTHPSGEGKSGIDLARHRFLPNLYALLILRKEPVAQDTDKDPAKPISGEAKPTDEGEGPKDPAKTPEKPGDGKANKQD